MLQPWETYQFLHFWFPKKAVCNLGYVKTSILNIKYYNSVNCENCLKFKKYVLYEINHLSVQYYYVNILKM